MLPILVVHVQLLYVFVLDLKVPAIAGEARSAKARTARAISFNTPEVHLSLLVVDTFKAYSFHSCLIQ